MKLAFVAHSYGNVALLERAIVALVDHHQVERVVALETAADDMEAVLRSRALRFPTELPPDDPAFADYVLASVLSGQVEVPAEEVERTERLRAACVVGRSSQIHTLARHRIGIGVTSADPNSLAVVVLTGVERRLIARDEAPVRVGPGHLRGPLHEGEPAACLVIEATEEGLQGQFVAPDGARLGRTEILEVGRG